MKTAKYQNSDDLDGFRSREDALHCPPSSLRKASRETAIVGMAVGRNLCGVEDVHLADRPTRSECEISRDRKQMTTMKLRCTLLLSVCFDGHRWAQNATFDRGRSLTAVLSSSSLLSLLSPLVCYLCSSATVKQSLPPLRMDPDPNLLTIPHEPMSLVDTPQQFPTTPSSSLGDSLCILSPLKIRESTFLKLGQATTKRFRLIEDEVDTVYVAQLSIHVPGSEEVIQ